MREITEAEVGGLEECLRALADYHDRVSVNFSGSYPSRPVEETLLSFRRALEGGASRIAAAEADGRIVGFCKADLHGRDGKLDYLVVLEPYRGLGLGGALMDWAMAAFAAGGADRVEVKVVDGNPAIRLYEKYGFRMNAHILVKGGRRGG